MALADRIKENRTKSGLSQAELAQRLCVSRQAVTKWESGRGMPDVENLKNMATLFDVSVDYLLDDVSAFPAGSGTLRQAVDVRSLEPHRAPGTVQGTRANAAVRQVFPGAEIWPLLRRRRNNGVQETIEWLGALLFSTPFLIFGTADSLSNRDAYYLVIEKNRTLLTRVSQESVESREVNTPPHAKRFTIGDDSFHRYRRPL